MPRSALAATTKWLEDGDKLVHTDTLRNKSRGAWYLTTFLMTRIFFPPVIWITNIYKHKQTKASGELKCSHWRHGQHFLLTFLWAALVSCYSLTSHVFFTTILSSLSKWWLCFTLRNLSQSGRLMLVLHIITLKKSRLTFPAPQHYFSEFQLHEYF